MNEFETKVAAIRAIMKDPNHALSNWCMLHDNHCLVAGMLQGLGVGRFEHRRDMSPENRGQWLRGFTAALERPLQAAEKVLRWAVSYEARYPRLDGGDRGDCALGMQEKNDCTVVALVAATSEQYEMAHAFFARLGRRNGRGVNTPAYLGKRTEWRECGWIIEGGRVGPKPVSVGRFMREIAGTKGRWIVRIAGHVLAIRDGIMVDRNQTGRRARITHAWRVTRRTPLLLPAPAGA